MACPQVAPKAANKSTALYVVCKECYAQIVRRRQAERVESLLWFVVVRVFCQKAESSNQTNV